MRNEWEITRIGDLGRVITGKTPPTDTPENFYGKYLFITPRDMVGSKNVHITERTVSDRGASLLKNCILPAKAICVSCIGSDMGKVVMTTKESITNQQLNSVICKESYNPAFIYYAITNISEELRNVAFQSTAVPILNKSSFSDFTIFCPPLPTQKAIAHILGTLDDKIELLHQMNETLEAIARALFKSWFVDFDPVRKKAESLPTGLPPEIDALFPDCLEDSELGEIPKGWEIGSIKQFCTAINEQLSPDQFTGTENYVGLEHIPRKSIALSDFGTSEDLESNKAQFTEDDILFGKLRPYFHKVVFAPASGICSTDILVIRPCDSDYFGFCLMHLSSEAVIEHATSYSNGTKMPRASWNDIQAYKVLVPPQKLIQFYNSISIYQLKLIKYNIQENKELVKIRDSLLPKLISGDLEVKDIDKILEPAT